MKLRYMIIGAGGVGGPVGAYLSKSSAVLLFGAVAGLWSAPDYLIKEDGVPRG